MSIMIDKIIFHNYRQYKDVTISFEHENDKNLSAIVAQNGTGKTTLINGINWCLYFEEPHLSDESKALPFLNETVLNSTNIDDVVSVSIEIIMIEDDKTISIKRTAKCFVIEDKGTKQVIKSNQSDLTITISCSESIKNADIIQGDDADVFVKQYFDKLIREYYFFDGEKLSEYFEKDKKALIKESIYNISQVTLLGNTISRLNTVATEYSRKVGAGNPEIEAINKKIIGLDEEIEKYEKSILDDSEKIEKYKIEIAGYEKQLRDFAPIKNKQLEREKLDKEHKKLVDELKNYKNQKMSIIRKNTYNLFMNSQITNLYNYIVEKENKGYFPPDVDKKKIQDSLDYQECAFCHSHLTEESEKYLMDLIEKLRVSNQTSNYLMSLKSSFEVIIEESQKYKDNIDDINMKIDETKAAINEAEDRLKEISKFLSSYDNGANAKSIVSEIEENRKNAETTKDLLVSKVSSNETLKKIAINNKETEENKLEEATSKKKEFEEYCKLTKAFRTASNSMQRVRDKIMIEIKNDIKEKTWDFFNSVLWKNNSFDSIDIDDNYVLSVKTKAGHETSGSLSATELMALAYAFTFAIHESSGKNCPLVIDSPLGRVSGENRLNMAKKFLEISKYKQIILLLTDDEVSPVMEEYYKDNGINIRRLSLTDNESEVKEEVR